MCGSNMRVNDSVIMRISLSVNGPRKTRIQTHVYIRYDGTRYTDHKPIDNSLDR